MKKSAFVSTALASVALFGLSGASNAATVTLSGVVDSCTPTCLSFDFLDVGSTVTGFLEFDDLGFADGSWNGGDVTNLSFAVENPALPPSASNPTVLDLTPAGSSVIVANGQDITNPRGTFPSAVSMGTQDGSTIDSGFVDLWLTEGLLANNGAVITLDFDTGEFTVGIFEGLIFVAGGTFTNEIQSSVIPVPAAAWLFGSALFGLLGLRRRAA